MTRSNRKTSRLSLEMTDVTRQKLEALRDSTQADSLTEVLRRSLAVYGYLWDEKKNGATIVVRRNGAERELVLL